MSTSTKIDLFPTTASPAAVSQKPPSEADKKTDYSNSGVKKCTQKHRPAAENKWCRPISSKALIIVLCVSSAALAYHRYTTHSIRVLSERLAFLENRCSQLALLNLQTSFGFDSDSIRGENDGEAAAATVSKSGSTKASTVVSSTNLVLEKADDNSIKQEVNEATIGESGGRGDGSPLEQSELGSGSFYIDDDYVDDDYPDFPASGDDTVYDGVVNNTWANVEAAADVKVRSRRSAGNVAHGQLPAGNVEEGHEGLDELPQGDDPAASTVVQRPRQSSSRRSSAATGEIHHQRHVPSSRSVDRSPRQKQSSSNQPSTSAIKAAQFVAPRRENYFNADESLPPVTYRFWQQDNMTLALRPQFFRLDDETGLVTIMEAGVYLLYAQIVYHDLTGRWAYGVYVDDSLRFKCINSEQLRPESDIAGQAGSRTSNSHSVYQSCYTSGLLQLKLYDKVSLRCLYGSRSVVMQPGFTFWGLVKLSPL